MKDIGRLTVRLSCSLRDALLRLDETAEGILLLVDEAGRLVRTITDGDIRRLLLHGSSLDAGLDILPPQEPKVAPLGASEADALEIMNRFIVDQVPIIDEHGHPCAIALRREIDSKILLSTPHLGDQEMGFVEEAFRTNWIAPLGPNVDAFERELAAYVGVDHAAAVASGTAALHLALRVLGVGAGDTVFCSSLTFVASAAPIVYQNAIPVFIDSDPTTWNMSPQALALALEDAARDGKRPKAVIVVNLYGQSADLEPLLQLCDRYGVPLIEDAAESLGATYKGKSSGTVGRLGIYSFNGNKIITTSGGGMLVSNDGELIEKARSLSMQAREATPWYEHREIGYNYRMSNILAGIGRGQLKVLEERVAARRAVFDRYRESLRDISALAWMPEATFGLSTRWLTVCSIDSTSGFTPARTIEALRHAGIEARHVWKPMHRQPVFSGHRYYPRSDQENFSDFAFATGLCLPSSSSMTPSQQERVIDALLSTFRTKSYANG